MDVVVLGDKVGFSAMCENEFARQSDVVGVHSRKGRVRLEAAWWGELTGAPGKGGPEGRASRQRRELTRVKCF